jgi:hypothetical protein
MAYSCKSYAMYIYSCVSLDADHSSRATHRWTFFGGGGSLVGQFRLRFRQIWLIPLKGRIHSLGKPKIGHDAHESKQKSNTQRYECHIKKEDREVYQAGRLELIKIRKGGIKEDVQTDCTGRSEGTPPPSVVLSSKPKVRYHDGSEGTDDNSDKQGQ